MVLQAQAERLCDLSGLFSTYAVFHRPPRFPAWSSSGGICNSCGQPRFGSSVSAVSYLYRDVPMPNVFECICTAIARKGSYSHLSIGGIDRFHLSSSKGI